MESGDRRCCHRISRGERSPRGAGSDDGRRYRRPPSNTCGGEQLTATEFKVESGVLFDHGG